MNDREQFEAWAKVEELNLMRADNMHCEDGVFDWEYYWSETESAWKSWQAARATPAQPVPDAYVPIHPRTGPLWASTIPSKDCDHPANYELRPVYFAPSPTSDVSAPSPSSVGAAIRALPLPAGDDYCASKGIYAFTAHQVRALLSEAAALAEQVQGQQTALSEEQIREKFEAWATSQKDKYIGLKLNSWRYNDGSRWYKYERTQHMYEGFRATFDAAPSIAQDGQCRADGRCQYAIDHGAEGMAACPVGKCCMPDGQKSEG